MRKRISKSCFSVMAGVVLFLFFVGCAHVEEEPAPEPEVVEETEMSEETFVEPPVLEEVEEEPEETGPAEYIHTVQWPGETLSLIAKWYTGKVALWQDLAKANPGLDPNRIFIGDQIRIPGDLLIKNEPMPRSAVPVAAPVTAPEPESEPEPESDEAPEFAEEPESVEEPESAGEPESAVEALPDEEPPFESPPPETEASQTPTETEEPPPGESVSGGEEPEPESAPPPKIFGPKDYTEN